MSVRELCLLLGSCWILGCASSPLRITESGFRNEKLQYDIRFRSDGTELLPSDWRLDNFYSVDETKLKPKTEGVYSVELELDIDGDGDIDRRDSYPSFEVRFEHLQSNGTIWLRALVRDEYDKDKDLRLLVSDMVDSIAGGYEFRMKGHTITTGDVRLAARKVAEGPAKLAGLEAFSSVVDIANVDQSLIAAPSVVRRLKTVLVRSGLVYKPTVSKKEFPVYLCAQYLEHPTQFEAHLPAFKQLLAQIQISEQVGYEESLSEIPAQVAPPPAPKQERAPATPPEPPSGGEDQG